jgi:hypothetical protein
MNRIIFLYGFLLTISASLIVAADVSSVVVSIKATDAMWWTVEHNGVPNHMYPCKNVRLAVINNQESLKDANSDTFELKYFKIGEKGVIQFKSCITSFSKVTLGVDFGKGQQALIDALLEEIEKNKNDVHFRLEGELLQDQPISYLFCIPASTLVKDFSLKSDAISSSLYGFVFPVICGSIFISMIIAVYFKLLISS